VKLGTKLSVAYFDQLREQLNEESTLADTISQGSDFVDIGGQRKHVISYLGDFLFAPERARSPVKSLSGGERNRLLLARLFTRPANVLVLDEPTNDLDIETLELLEELLDQYDGTLFLVSHDRAFLDNVVTQVISFEGDGKLMEYVGGYEDWVRMKKFAAQQLIAPIVSAPKSAVKIEPTKAKSSNKLNSKEARELEGVPQQIEVLEKELESIAAALGAGDLYRDNPSHAKQLQQRSSEINIEVQKLMARWEALESRL
jgi:ATP-binding cassette subfamily F protein uup